MNLQFCIEKLTSCEKFKKFKKEYKNSFFGYAFFVIDLEDKEDKQHFDFYIPGEKSMTSFQLEKGCEAVNMEILDKKIPEEISLDFNFDFNEVEKLIADRMKKEEIKNKIHKMLFSLQKINGEHFLIGTIFISMLGMLKINIDLSKMEIIDFQKKSFFDIMKIMKGKKGD